MGDGQGQAGDPVGAPARPRGLAHHVDQRGAGLVDFQGAQGRVDEEHQAGFAQLPGHRQALGRAPAGAVEGLFQVHLRAGAGEAGHAAGADLGEDAVAVPALAQLRRLDEDVALVGGVLDLRRDLRHPQPGQAARAFPEPAGVGQAAGVPAGHTAELDAADHRLGLHHPPVAAEALVQPAEARPVLALVDRLPALAVVLQRPHARPQPALVGGDHAALAAGGHDLVLAERPGPDMADGAHRAALVARPVGLGAVLDDLQAALGGQGHDRVHVAGPAGQVHADHRPGARGQHRADARGGDVLRIAVDLGEHRCGAGVDDAGDRSEEGPRGDHHLVAGADFQRPERLVQGQGAVGQGDGVAGAGPVGEFPLEFPALLAGPVVDPVGQDHAAYGLGLFLGEGRPGGEGCVQHVGVPVAGEEEN